MFCFIAPFIKWKITKLITNLPPLKPKKNVRRFEKVRILEVLWFFTKFKNNPSFYCKFSPWFLAANIWKRFFSNKFDLFWTTMLFLWYLLGETSTLSLQTGQTLLWMGNTVAMCHPVYTGYILLDTSPLCAHPQKRLPSLQW